MKLELQKIKDRRETIRNNYLELAQGIWSSEMEIERKDSKVRVEYNKYRNEDRHLERLEQMLNTVIDDLTWYEETFIK
jgi:murein tripeptide amidase MpaA